MGACRLVASVFGGCMLAMSSGKLGLCPGLVEERTTHDKERLGHEEYSANVRVKAIGVS